MKWYYPSDGIQTASSSFVVYHLTFRGRNLVLQNDSTSNNNLEISWDGSTTHFHLKPGEPLNLGDLEFEEIWIKKSGGTVTFRIAAYAK